MDVNTVVLVVVGVDAIFPGTGVGLCGAVLMVVFSFISVEGQCWVFAPDYNCPNVFHFLV